MKTSCLIPALVCLTIGCMERDTGVSPQGEVVPKSGLVPPTPVYPKNGRYLSFSQEGYLFRWMPTDDAEAYLLQVSESSTFSPLAFGSSVYVLSQFSSPLRLGTHYWRVRARLKSGTWTPWSDTRSFTVIPVVP